MIFSLQKMPWFHLIFFPQNFHTRKLGEIKVFFAVFEIGERVSFLLL